MKHTNIVIYPCYIDSNVKLFDGRKISKEFCVENPNLNEMTKAYEQLGFKGIQEPKKIHPRDFFRPGRITVEFFTAEKKPLNPEIKNRKQFYISMAKKIKEIREIAANSPQAANKQKGKKGKR